MCYFNSQRNSLWNYHWRVLAMDQGYALHTTKVKTHHLILINIMLIVPVADGFRVTKNLAPKNFPRQSNSIKYPQEEHRRSCRHRFKAPGMGVHLHSGNAWYSSLSRPKFWGANIKYVFTGVSCILRNKEEECPPYPSAPHLFSSPLPRLVLPRTSHTALGSQSKGLQR